VPPDEEGIQGALNECKLLLLRARPGYNDHRFWGELIVVSSVPVGG